MLNYNDTYKELVKTILEQGVAVPGRNGIVKTLPMATLPVEDMNNDFKLLLRKMYYKGVLGEFKTLINPEPLTNVSQFEDNGCPYWSEWTGPNGELNLDYHNKLHPQLEDIIYNINSDPYSRRHVIELWDHENVKSGKLSLPCCWHGMTFSVLNNTLYMVWVQRSVDVMLGLPSDVYLAHLFMKYIADRTELKIGSCLFALSNVHIYENHIDNAKKLLDRTTEDFDKPLKFDIVP
jgi:thymidylate synthase